jgi:hypothetical protein
VRRAGGLRSSLPLLGAGAQRRLLPAAQQEEGNAEFSESKVHLICCCECQVDYIFYGTTSLDERCRDFFDDMQRKFAAHNEFKSEGYKSKKSLQFMTCGFSSSF